MSNHSSQGLPTVDDAALAKVVGGKSMVGQGWDLLDAGAEMIPGLGWKDKSCLSRQYMVGSLYGLGVGLGATYIATRGGGATMTKAGVWKGFGIGQATGWAGASILGSYSDNCMSKKK